MGNLCEKEIEEAREAFTPEPVRKEYRRLSAHRRETLEFHMPYSEETRNLLCVRNGDPEGVLAFYANMKKGGGHGGEMGRDALEQARCVFMAGVTLFTRFAVEGGLEQEEAYNLSDAYIRVMLSMHDGADILAMVPNLGADMATRVRETKRTRSGAVKVCLTYISNHIHYKVTVAELAEACALTPGYLSVHFKEHMGVGLQEYILGEKLEAALRMLQRTHCSVAEAASQFAFPSHSAFSAHFKRKYGETPARYIGQGQATAWKSIAGE